MTTLRPFLTIDSERQSGSLEDIWSGLSGVMGTLIVGIYVSRQAAQGYMGGSPMPMHELLFVLEYGNRNNRIPNTPEGKPAPIPPRPVITPFFQRNGQKYVRRFSLLTLNYASSKRDPRPAMEALGKTIITDLAKEYFVAKVLPPSQATLDIRGRRRSKKPLIDTKKLLRSFAFKWIPKRVSNKSGAKAARSVDALLSTMSSWRKR